MRQLKKGDVIWVNHNRGNSTPYCGPAVIFSGQGLNRDGWAIYVILPKKVVFKMTNFSTNKINVYKGGFCLIEG
jgi:hypothetical protein